MTTPRTIITLALSKLGIAGGAKKPRQEDLDLGLVTLQSYYRFLISSGALGRPRNTVLDEGTTDYVAHENESIHRVNPGIQSIELPLTVTDDNNNLISDKYYDCYYGGVRTPRNGTFVVIVDAISGNSQESIYDGYTKNWCSIGDLDLDESQAPLSSNLNGLASRLAQDLSDHYDAELNQVTVVAGRQFEAALIQGFGDDEHISFANYF